MEIEIGYKKNVSLWKAQTRRDNNENVYYSTVNIFIIKRIIKTNDT